MNRYIESNVVIDNEVIITCDNDIICECYRIADGSFTPITGFFNKQDMDKIILSEQLLNGTYFPIPIYMQIDRKYLHVNANKATLVDEKNNTFGYIEGVEVFEYSLDKLSQFIFGTTDRLHPGVEKLYSKGNVFIGGQIYVKRKEDELSHYCLTPTESREIIKQRNLKALVGFQTRNVPHKAHEHLQKISLEVHGALLIHPIIGWKKKGDYLPDVVMDVYKDMISNFYPKEKVILGGLQLAMRYAGPKEAIFHAIIRQNYGCTHFVVGRDHAGVGGFYGKYEAHETVSKVEDKLDIKILKLKGPHYCKKCDMIVTENTCGHSTNNHIEISGTIIRNQILDNKYPPEYMIRKEVVDSILKHKKIFV